MAPNDFRRVADAFLSAPFEREGWDHALKELARTTRSSHGNLVEVIESEGFSFNRITDAPSGLVESLEAIDGGRPEINWRVACSAAPFALVWESSYRVKRRELASSPYNDLVEQFDMPNGCQTVLAKTPDSFFGLAVLRTRSDGETTAADRAAFAAAAPYALAAIRIQTALARQGAALMAGAFDSLAACVFVLDRRGRVLAMSAQAEASLRSRASLRLSAGRLSARGAEDDRRLQRALEAALRDVEQPAPGIRLWLRGGEDAPSGRACEVFPLPRKDWALGLEPRALVILRGPAEACAERCDLLRDALGLTPTEAEIAALAADGLSRREIAAIRGSSYETVKSQLRRIFEKSGVQREAQLVALIHRLLR